MANLDNNYNQALSADEQMADSHHQLSGGIQAHNAKQTALAHGLVNQALSSLSAESNESSFNN